MWYVRLGTPRRQAEILGSRSVCPLSRSVTTTCKHIIQVLSTAAKSGRSTWAIIVEGFSEWERRAALASREDGRCWRGLSVSHMPASSGSQQQEQQQQLQQQASVVSGIRAAEREKQSLLACKRWRCCYRHQVTNQNTLSRQTRPVDLPKGWRGSATSSSSYTAFDRLLVIIRDVIQTFLSKWASS